jgi:hypothetical protein
MKIKDVINLLYRMNPDEDLRLYSDNFPEDGSVYIDNDSFEQCPVCGGTGIMDYGANVPDYRGHLFYDSNAPVHCDACDTNHEVKLTSDDRAKKYSVEELCIGRIKC